MLRTIGKTFGMAIAGMCLVSTLAMAQMSPPGQSIVCTVVDVNGYCIEARAEDNKAVTVRVEGLKVGEKMLCVKTATDTTCTKVTVTK